MRAPSALVVVIALIAAAIVSSPVAAAPRKTVQREFTVQRDGFGGRYFTPVHGADRPAVLVVGGSSGGLIGSATIAETLAGQGFPALAVAYFQRPGLPDTLSSIPLEYFEPALEALKRQPEVRSGTLAVLGNSRGSEAALLLGVHYPDLVSAVVGLSPANVAVCSIPSCDGPSWTFGGAPLPYTQPTIGPSAAAAEIPVEEIHGPIFLACGLLDSVWPSCSMAASIVNRLREHGSPYGHRTIAKYRAGHVVGFPPDPEPVQGAAGIPTVGGGTYDNNQKAQRETWKALARWLHSVGR